MRLLRTSWPLLVALVALWAALGLTAAKAVKANDGRFIYALDDAYIHMAMAKNLAQHGVWGVTRHEFSSSSSSPLWTLALAGWYGMGGVDEAAPFLMNLALSSLLLLVVDALLRREPGVASWARALLLLGVVFLGPLTALVFGGMEHVAQTLLDVVFVFWMARVLERGRCDAREAAGLAALAVVMVAARYEGLFLVAAACGLLLLQRRWKLAVALGAAAWAPVAAYGAVSVAHGWFWLPNSLLMKGNTDAAQSLSRLLFHAWQDTLFEARELLLLLAGATVVYGVRLRRGVGVWERRQILLALFVAAALLHAMFARVGWLFRYEAYLIVMGLLSVAVASRELAAEAAGAWRSWLRWERAPELAAWALLALLPLVAFEQRYELGLKQAQRFMTDRYLEQYSQARFLRGGYNDATIVIHEIGMAAFYTDMRLLDVAGLASREPVDCRLRGEDFGVEQVRAWARRKGVRVAALKTNLKRVAELVPPEWIHVMDWRAPRMGSPLENVTSFYAVDPAEAEPLRRRLAAFVPSLRREVKWTWVGETRESAGAAGLLIPGRGAALALPGS
ncbi:MAG TPA: hypothetical protein P5137_06730 [Candidatus Brocadiia bacterium]|nr:hypothetical protein [Candidatus Brocadiia bacterium]